MHQGINTAADKVDYASSGIPIIQSRNFTSGVLDLDETKFIGIEDEKKYGEKYKPRKGDVLFSNIGTVGKSVVIEVEKDFLFAWNVFLIRPKSAHLYSRYLQNYLNYLLGINFYERWFTGGTVKFLNKKTIAEFEIPLPPLAEQQRIAAILDAADSLRQKDQQLVERYTTLSQSLFLEMFGDPVTNPMEWEINELEKLVKNDRSITYGILKPEENHDDGVIMLRIQDIKGSRVSLNKVHKVSQELSRQYKRTILEGNEIVISLVGTIGLTAKIPPELAQSNVHRNLGVIALNKEKIQTDFFFQYTLLGSFQTLIKKMTTGGNQPLLNLGALNTLGVIVPPLTLQNQFAERIQLIEAQKQQAQASLEKSEALFNSLLQRAFTGELTAKMAA